MRTKVVIIFLLISCSISFAQDADVQKSNWLLGVIFKLENMRDKAIEDIRKYEGNIRKCENTISKSENIVRLAQQKGNVKAGTVAREASIKAQEAKRKNRDNKNSAELNKKRAEEALAYVKTGGKDLESKLEQVEFENAKPDWVKNQKQLIEERLKKPNPYIDPIYTSLKTKAPPPLPPRKYEMLKPGDVLLISPEDKSFWNTLIDQSAWIAAADRVSSTPPLSVGDRASQSPASHTVLYLKEVNGTKLFLDHTSERGSHVISEAEFLRTYGQRDALVASPRIVVAQPLKEAETAKIWEFTKELVKKEQEKQANTSESRTDSFRDRFRDLSGFGLYGEDNMVCSEADRWVLVNSGRKIPETASPLKRLLGIHYGPANFFSDEENFIITPLYGVPK